MASKRKDFTQIAFDVVRQATGDTPKRAPASPKSIASSKGGKTGGRTRMDALTPEQRIELAKQAASARWAKAAPVIQTGAGEVKKRSG
jgi:hypothetical protein